MKTGRKRGAEMENMLKLKKVAQANEKAKEKDQERKERGRREEEREGWVET